MTEKWYNNENAEFYGHDGKLQIESPISTGRIYPLATIAEQSWAEAGVRKLPGNDINTGNNVGLGKSTRTGGKVLVKSRL